MFPNDPVLEKRWRDRRDLLEQILNVSFGDPIAGQMPSEEDAPVRVSFDGDDDVDPTCFADEDGRIRVRISPKVFFRIQSMALCVVLCDFARPFPYFFLGRGFEISEAHDLLGALADPDQDFDLLPNKVGEAFTRTATDEPWVRISPFGGESNVICQFAFFQLIAMRLHRFFCVEKYHVVDRAAGEIADAGRLEIAVYAQCAQAAGATLADRVDADLAWYAIDPRAARYGRRVRRMAQCCGVASAIACDIDAIRPVPDAPEWSFINDTILPRIFRDELAIRRGPQTADDAYVAFVNGKQLYRAIREQPLPQTLDETAAQALFKDLFTLSAKLKDEMRRRHGPDAIERRLNDLQSAADNFDPDSVNRMFKPRSPFDEYEQ